MGLLKLENLLDYVHRIVRNAEALTMFIAKLRYMFVPSVDSLCLGCLDDSDHWKVIWEGVLPQHMAFWKSTGLSERQIFQIHNQHRAEMIDLRSIFRRHTKVDPETLQSQVQSHVCHVDPDASLLGIFRQAPDPNDCLLILFNFGSQVFRSEMSYELPVPSGYEGQWQVLVDGDWIDPKQRLPGDPEFGYSPGAIVETTAGHFSNQAHVLRLSIGIISLVVLKYCPAL
ncbi:MAG: hypothetical protein HC925_01170 [Coleofasciculaceae cyanobacterium SM2_3_26]|nr:hypothetical protein [Coleofasciculaceae cyanobacterium SM2_3_26]